MESDAMRQEDESVLAFSSTDMLGEAKALQKVLEAVAGLPVPAVKRIVGWLADSYGLTATGTTKRPFEQRDGKGGAGSERESSSDERTMNFASVAELYDAANPDTESRKALVVGYWFQFIQKQDSFTSQAVNKALKDLGHGVANITAAFDDLAEHQPVWARQVKKAGTSRQARKLYRVTSEGAREVQTMIRRAPEEE